MTGTKREIITEPEQELAIKLYDYGWSFQEITERLLDLRKDVIRHDLNLEVASTIAHRFQRQSYPLEHYGVLESHR